MLALVRLCCMSAFWLLTAFAYHVPSLQKPLSQTIDDASSFPTIRESAIQARRVLRLESISTLSTIFPDDTSHDEHDELGGMPIGLMSYYADCEDAGNPTILAVSITTSVKNAEAGSNVSMSLRWHPSKDAGRSAANLPRFSLIGHLEPMGKDDVTSHNIESCFGKTHPDARAWMPGNDIHDSYWARLVVEKVYWFGGFGDRAYIGWLPISTWNNITQVEIEQCRLPGES